MNLKRINSVSEINTADVTFQSVYWKYGTGVDTSTGKGINKLFMTFNQPVYYT